MVRSFGEILPRSSLPNSIRWKTATFFAALAVIIRSGLLPKLIVVSLVTLLDVVKMCRRASAPLFSPISLSPRTIDETQFSTEEDISLMIERIGSAGPRTTGSSAHESFMKWIETELSQIQGISVSSDEYTILKWEAAGSKALRDVGQLTLLDDGKAIHVPIGGAVPFSKPTAGGQSAPIVYLPRGVAITEANSKGKIVVRDLPAKPIPYAMGFLPAYSRTNDLTTDMFSDFDRPGLADMPLKEELITAGKVGARGMIICFDVAREHIVSYFEPHQGVHYRIPAVFVGADEAHLLKSRAHAGSELIGRISITADIAKATTRNILATLPGQSLERVIYQTHTDGNTYVQENGPAALLALTRYFAKQPLSTRRRTIQFAFNTGHLHISREGTARQVDQLDATYDDGSLALLIPIEHLGTREIEARSRPDGKPGKELYFSGRGEVMFWSVGPSPVVVSAVQHAVRRRGLDRTLITRGTSRPNFMIVPTYTSFGGIGTYSHNKLLPTTSLMSGPWSLWAPSFGKEAIDITRFRKQALALGDIFFSIEHASRETIAAGYLQYRKRRANGAREAPSLIPEELA